MNNSKKKPNLFTTRVIDERYSTELSEHCLYVVPFKLKIIGAIFCVNEYEEVLDARILGGKLRKNNIRTQTAGVFKILEKDGVELENNEEWFAYERDARDVREVVCIDCAFDSVVYDSEIDSLWRCEIAAVGYEGLLVQEFDTVKDLYDALVTDMANLDTTNGDPLSKDDTMLGSMDTDLEIKQMDDKLLQEIKLQSARMRWLESKGLSNWAIRDICMSDDGVDRGWDVSCVTQCLVLPTDDIDRLLVQPWEDSKIVAGPDVNLEAKLGLAKVLACMEFADKLEEIDYIVGKIAQDILDGELSASVDVNTMTYEQIVEELQKRSVKTKESMKE